VTRERSNSAHPQTQAASRLRGAYLALINKRMPLIELLPWRKKNNKKQCQRSAK
jgi:hypothetical protein